MTLSFKNKIFIIVSAFLGIQNIEAQVASVFEVDGIKLPKNESSYISKNFMLEVSHGSRRVKALIPELKQKYPISKLDEAILLDDVKEVIALLKKKVPLNDTANASMSPLMWSVIFNHLEIAEILLLNGANSNFKTPEGLTPLHYAVIWQMPEMVKVLLKYGADTTITLHGQTPMDQAKVREYFDIMAILQGAEEDRSKQ